VATLLSPAATLGDKWRVGRLRSRLKGLSLEDLQQRPERTTREALRENGFGPVITERFFRSFLGGIFLDRNLETSSRMFDFVFRMFAEGDAALPAGGMESIPQQLLERLPRETIETDARVERIEGTTVHRADGGSMRARAVVVATEGPAAASLTHEPFNRQARSVECHYYVTDRPPIAEPILVLNGEPQGPINNLCVPSQVAAGYAPAGRSVMSVSVVSNHPLPESDVRSQLRQWFGQSAADWPRLRSYAIPYALPAVVPPTASSIHQPVTTSQPGLFVCGDHRDTASIQGAMLSGRRAAEAVLTWFETMARVT
jgi:phytoene dehydrogenase-like protein